MGRRAIAIEDHIDKLIAAILLGATYELAAQYAGISADTFDRWRSKARTAKPGTPLATLRDRLREAEGKAAVTWLRQIEKAAKEGNWNAAAWKLERRYPELYGRVIQKQEHTGPVGGPVQIQVLYEGEIVPNGSSVFPPINHSEIIVIEEHTP